MTEVPDDCNQWSSEAIEKLENATWRADDTHETYAARNGLTPGLWW